MSLNNMATARNFAAQRLALRWAKENLPEDEYKEIKTAYDKGIRKTLLFVVICCIPIMVVCLLIAFLGPFSTHIENSAMPDEASGYVMAKIDYDSNFYWTADSKIYEYPLEEYGVSAEKYKFGDKIKIYIDDDQNVIKVSEVKESIKIREAELIAGVLGSILIPLAILLIYRRYAKRTFAKAWFDFYENF